MNGKVVHLVLLKRTKDFLVYEFNKPAKATSGTTAEEAMGQFFTDHFREKAKVVAGRETNYSIIGQKALDLQHDAGIRVTYS
ncbi:MAG: hypothetical protein WCP93_00850 [Candidatus Berkelbacteria bacterium]